MLDQPPASKNQPEVSGDPRLVFRLLILYRWISLIPPLLFIFSAQQNQSLLLILLAVSLLPNLLITLFSGQLNALVLRSPWLLLTDFLLVAACLGLSGGEQSPYYLYALSPLIAAGFFFQLRGAVTATTLFLPLYTAVLFLHFQLTNSPINWLTVIVNVTGFYLISGAFGYAAVLLNQLQHLSQSQRQARLRHAKESAIQAERARIALEIHDTLSQSLFGIVFTLDGTLKLLDRDPTAIRSELEWAKETAESARQEIRRTIHDLWSEEITPEAFQIDLNKYATDVLQANHLNLQFDIRGSFDTLSPRACRSLYRMTQECLTNIVHHAAASEAKVCVDVENGRARLVVRDNGRGFEPDIALAQEHGQEHFGLRGMQNRARSLGGTCDIFSQPKAGSSIVIDIPAAWQNNGVQK